MITKKISDKDFEVVEEIKIAYNVDSLMEKQKMLVKRRDTLLSNIDRQINEIDLLLAEASKINILTI